MGGYVVIPPSTHVNGNEYMFEEGVQDIQELPDWISKSIKELTRTRKTNGLKKPLSRKKNGCVKPTTSTIWSTMTIPQIQDHMAKGNKIPTGVRNSVIHRLLSSERAKGALQPDLLKFGKKYLKQVEDSGTFALTELKQIVSSVMKYPSYNTSHEKVNDIYGKWMIKNGFKLPTNYIQSLKSEDDVFFKSLKKCERGGMALSSLKTLREEFLKGKGLKHLSSYKDSLLAQKLKDLGFTRLRTAKGNLWNVVVQEQKEETMTTPKKKNKREIYYPGASTREFHEKLRAVLGCSLEEQRKAYQEFMNSLLPGDEFGLGFSIYKEVDKLPNGQLVAKNQNGNIVTFGLDDMAMAPLYCVAGLAEILYRNNEPFLKKE